MSGGGVGATGHKLRQYIGGMASRIRMSGPDDKKPPPATRGETGLALDERTRTKKPPMYKVLLHNDDYTTKEFVVSVLQTLFYHSEVEATRIMLHVHNNGVGVAGVFSYEIAETKAEKTMALARQFEYPLRVTVEKE